MRRCLPFALPLAFFIILIILCPLAGSAQGLGLPLHPWGKPPPMPPVDWYAANQKLSVELRTAEIGDLTQRALRDPTPTTAAGWLRRLALLMRAEYRQDALAMLKSRPRFLGPQWNWQINDLASQAVTYHFPELALSVCERFPEEGYAYTTIDAALVALPPAIRVDAWLARQGMKGYGQWFLARLRLRANEGTERELIAPLERRVRAHRADLAAIGEYLWAVQQMPGPGTMNRQMPGRNSGPTSVIQRTPKPEDMTWLSTVCKPRLAAQSLMVGQQFSLVGIDAIPLYERSLQTPFRQQDVTWYADYLKRSLSAYGGPQFALTEKQLRLWTKTALMEAYKKSGQIARAQALLEELTAQNPDGLPDPFQAFGAGQTQGASGARVIEARIQAAEKKPENRESSDYWLERALYYSGRKEDGPAVEAFERALKLSPIPDNKAPWRWWNVVEAYQRHLWLRGNIDNPVETVAFLRREIALVPPESDYARSLMNEIANYETPRSHFITPDDPQIWKLLAAQTDWTHFGFLQDLERNTPPEERDAVWMRLEELARQGSVNRAYVLGQTERYSGAAGRAILFLQQALTRTQDKEQQWELLTALWEAQSDVHDWRGMEATLPRLAAVVGPTFDPTDKWREIAEDAARSGAPQEAMRYFRLWANQDRRPIPTFAYNGYGVAEELKPYLQQLKVAEPRCATPALCDFKPHRGNGPQGPSGRVR